MRNTLEPNDPTSQRQHITGPPVELITPPSGDGKLRAVGGKEKPRSTTSVVGTEYPRKGTFANESPFPSCPMTGTGSVIRLPSRVFNGHCS